MTLFRTITVLLAALAVMLIVVILRSETTRLHFEISLRERRAEQVRSQLREAELELARLRNPMMIRQQVKEALAEYLEAAPPRETPRNSGAERPPNPVGPEKPKPRR